MVLTGAGLLSGDPVCAGAWPLPEGDGQIILPVTLTKAKKTFDSAGRLVGRHPYDKLEIAPYMEYGFSGSLTLIGELSFIRDHTKYYIWDFNRAAMNRAEAGARLSLGTWQETLFSMQMRGIYHFSTAVDDPYVSRGGDVDGELGLVLGRNFTLFGVNGFTDMQLHYTWKPRDLPGEVGTDLTIGLKPRPGTMLLLKGESIASIGGKPDARMQIIRATKLGFSLVQNITPSVAIELGAMQTLMGRNIIRERSLRLGFWYEF